MDSELNAILTEAEHKVHLLLERKLQAGNYKAVANLAAIAEWLAKACTLNAADGQVDDATVFDSKVPDPMNATQVADSELEERSETGVYPVFFREGDRLVKVGRSRGAASTYEHKVGRGVLDRVIARLCEAARDKPTFLLDSIGDIQLSAEGSKVPSYQVYLCIAWLKEVGVLKVVGRKRYGLADQKNLRRNVTQAWAQLHQR